jgi:hypothetical protein
LQIKENNEINSEVVLTATDTQMKAEMKLIISNKIHTIKENELEIENMRLKKEAIRLHNQNVDLGMAVQNASSTLMENVNQFETFLGIINTIGNNEKSPIENLNKMIAATRSIKKTAIRRMIEDDKKIKSFIRKKNTTRK